MKLLSTELGQDLVTLNKLLCGVFARTKKFKVHRKTSLCCLRLKFSTHPRGFIPVGNRDLKLLCPPQEFS